VVAEDLGGPRGKEVIVGSGGGEGPSIGSPTTSGRG